MKYPQDYNVVLIVSSAAELKTKYSSPKLPEPLQTSNITDSRDSGHEYVNSTLSKILKEMKILEPHVSSQMGKGMLRKMHYDLDKVIGILESEFHKKSSPAKTPIFRQLSATDLSSPLHSISQTAEVVGGQIISSLSGFSKAVGKVIDESRHSVSAGSQPRSQQLFHVSSSSSSRPPTSKSMQSVFQTDNIDDGSTKKLEKNSSSKSLNQIGDADPLSSSIYPPP